ncbi:hypothetical protein K491DRAFT_680689 [Lophiostoma macrostomum CBS 122681]|uniref:Uncharacterized protein n=1 Tax=Lophiostoma macrostomum CBS 122681 TaxID=1314788 RepID=A0A6A6T0D7_9PLEO|nr:hypothetical protein K491DRAFT_680689 [Lophiostoma macrostomum CBS 122681]
MQERQDSASFGLRPTEHNTIKATGPLGGPNVLQNLYFRVTNILRYLTPIIDRHALRLPARTITGSGSLTGLRECDEPQTQGESMWLSPRGCSHLAATIDRALCYYGVCFPVHMYNKIRHVTYQGQDQALGQNGMCDLTMCDPTPTSSLILFEPPCCPSRISAIFTKMHVLDFSRMPACAQHCSVLHDADSGCVPPSAPVTNQETYQQCVCASTLLTSLHSSGALCQAFCSSDDSSAISQYYNSLCKGPVVYPGSSSTATGIDAGQMTTTLSTPRNFPSNASTDHASHATTSPRITLGMIIAIILGGISAITLILLGLWMYRRRIRPVRPTTISDDEVAELDGREVRRAELATAANTAELDSKEKKGELASAT